MGSMELLDIIGPMAAITGPTKGMASGPPGHGTGRLGWKE